MLMSLNRIFTLGLIPAILLSLLAVITSAEEGDTPSAGTQRELFQVAEHRAFVIMPKDEFRKEGPVPWIRYAPTLGDVYPREQEYWMFNHFLKEGIAIAGIDAGESYGSPKGSALFQSLYQELTLKRHFGPKPVLLARSRGGLMLYNWAVDHPDSVGGIAGIYPVCNLASYPGLKRAAPAYKMTEQELQKNLTTYNPIDRLARLAKAKVPIFHIHGDIDKVVPLEANSAIVAKRYKSLGGPMELEVVKGQGHNLWEGWFHSERLTKFVIQHAIKK